MKSYNHLWEKCIAYPNLEAAAKSVKHSRRIRKILKERHMSDDALSANAYDWLVNYKNAKHSYVHIYDGTSKKQRRIIVPTLEELTVQHAVVNVLKPMFYKGMYEHSYASIPKKGAVKGMRVTRNWIKRDRHNTKYILKMDIAHFFDSIPHDKLKAKLKKYLRDEKMLQIMYDIIDVTNEGEGIPLGFYTSQWLSNWYLQGLDHYIKEDLKAKYYIRYMDDMVIFGSNKKKLHRMRKSIEEYLNKELGLQLKKNWQVFLFDWNGKGRDLDFMGFRFYRNRIVLRRSLMLRASRKARKIAKKEHPNVHDYKQMMSYYGWIKHTDSHTFAEEHITPYVSFKSMKKHVSKIDRRDPLHIYTKLALEYYNF